MSSEVDSYRARARSVEVEGLTAMQDAILLRVIDGEGIAQICRDPAMPSKAIVFRWLAANAAFRDAYEIASKLRGEHMFEQALEIANAEPPRIVVQVGENITESRVDPGAVQHARLKVSTLQWAAAKLNPKRFGEKLDVTSGGERVGREINENDKFVRLAAMVDEIKRRSSDA